ncbi:MAG: DUF2812 domain-containing protein, partial [Spirochaetales bacterium]|nr:DUF2812 domain-containing protein [Spirochaetales bacterium]
KRVFKWWFAWDFEKIESWLETMAKDGWILESTSLLGFNFYFRESAPVNMRYCIDYLHTLKPEYRQLTEDDGWEILNIVAGWYVFFKKYADRRPDLYTDSGSLLERNKRLIGLFIATGIPVTVVFPRAVQQMENDTASIVITIIYILLIGFYIFGMTKLLKLNRNLKGKKDSSP